MNILQIIVAVLIANLIMQAFNIVAKKVLTFISIKWEARQELKRQEWRDYIEFKRKEMLNKKKKREDE